jgi:2-polyprenyl-6-methoxyphenol hydroxylase-like FAD-dependent oxidoreductase
MFEVAPDVLIIGAGPVGLFTALTLARRGVRVQIADTALWTCAHSYALALHPQTLTLMKEAGVDVNAEGKAFMVKRIAIYEGETRKAEVPLGEGLAVLRQDAIESQLEKALNDAGVDVQWRHEASDLRAGEDHVKVRLDKFEKDSCGYVIAHEEWMVAKSTELDVPWVIGADGYDSTVRRALGAGFPETGPAEYYAVVEFKSNEPPPHELRIALGEHTTDALWPLPNGNMRWSFQLPDYKDAHELPGPGYFLTSRLRDRDPKPFEIPVLEESTLRSLIAQRAPWFKGEIGNISWRTVVRFEHRQASQYGSGRMWLAGDAAHLTGPVGVLSMNLGLVEGYELAEIIADGGKEQELQAFNHRWSATWRQVHGMDKGVPLASGADPWIAAHLERILPCLPGWGSELTAIASNLIVMA